MPISKRRILADFITNSFRVVGEAHIGSAGFTGLMNDDAYSLLEIYGANVAGIHMPTKLMDVFDIIQLARKKIVAVCLKRREDVGPHLVGQSGYGVLEYPVWLATDVYQIEGTIEWQGRFDFSMLMAESARNFVPLYNARIKMVLVPSANFECEAMFFNRRYLSMMTFTKTRKQWE